jgi:hypothetical protein
MFHESTPSPARLSLKTAIDVFGWFLAVWTGALMLRYFRRKKGNHHSPA